MHNFKLKLTLVIVSLFGSGALMAVPAYADCTNNPQTTAEAVSCGTTDAAGGTVTAAPTDTLNNLIETALNLLSVAVGIAAVFMLVVGAYRYITSAGDSSKVGNAKNTIMYAMIGLVIVALSQVIVQFVLNKATVIQKNTPATSGGTGTVSHGGQAK